jgi:exo-beta-1,3-glucanase (GH17 family)
MQRRTQGLLGPEWAQARKRLPGACLALLLLAAAPPVAAAPAVCAARPAAHAALGRLRAALGAGRFIAYQPTSLRVLDGRVQAADAASIRADLAVLRPRFDSLLTYDAVHGAEAVADVAAELGFRALVIGIWDPTDGVQVDAALAAARRHPRLVVGLSLGNERILARRADFAGLAATVAALRARAPGLALSTTEPFHLYEQPAAAALLARLDFLLVNVHPAFQPWFAGASDAVRAQFVANVVRELAAHYCGPILVKETGVPTAPATAGFSEERQAAFYRELRARFPARAQSAFAYFSAFDAPWRAYDAGPVEAPGTHPEEAHWGLYDSERRAKAAARELPPL